MKRRAVVSGVVAVLAAPLTAQAQPTGTVPRVGFLYFGSRQTGPGADRYAAFLAGMRDLGYVEGRGLVIEPWWGEGAGDRVERLAGDIVASQPDVIVAAARRRA